MQQLDEVTLREVLLRAEEIDSGTQSGVKPAANFEEMVAAAEEAGLSRHAISQALRERFGWQGEALMPDTLVWAKSADGNSYLARVVGTNQESVKVRFLSGSEKTLPYVDIQEFSVIPGATLNYNSPTWSTWINGQVVRYNEDTRSVTFNTWGTEETITLDKVRLAKTTSDAALKMHYWMYFFMFLCGGVVGAIVLRLLTRN
jgi:hypothetical protein